MTEYFLFANNEFIVFFFFQSFALSGMTLANINFYSIWVEWANKSKSVGMNGVHGMSKNICQSSQPITIAFDESRRAKNLFSYTQKKLANLFNNFFFLSQFRYLRFTDRLKETHKQYSSNLILFGLCSKNSGRNPFMHFSSHFFLW